MTIELDKSIYSIEAIRNTVYWFSSHEIIISDNDSKYLVISESFDSNTKKEFMVSLNDFSLREQINKESKDIKDLVIAKAFYPDLVKFKNVGDYDDPVNIVNDDTN